MDDSKRDSRDNSVLEAAIVEWFAMVEREGSPDKEAFVARHPECELSLREFLNDLEGFQELAGHCSEPLDARSILSRTGAAIDPSDKGASPDSDRSGTTRMGTYDVLHEISRGGMGIVFKARDRDLKREVAIKVLLEQHCDKTSLAQRFVDEARIAGQLQHPGITPVYELGEFPDGRPYFAMKLVEGQTFAQLLQNRSDPRADRQKFVKIFEQICQTLAYAHSRHVIHRDLKPSNIMVGAFDEIQVMDWGLAKVLDTGEISLPRTLAEDRIHTLQSEDADFMQASGSRTQAGSVLGTLAYMPPEQALGQIDHLDQRSDVFGLGAILLEILTGRPPYGGTTAEQLRRKAVTADLAEAFESLAKCDADEELKRITRCALAREPANRPADAKVLARELTNYREGVETRLRHAELAEVRATTRAAEERARRQLSMRFSTAVLVVLAVGIIGTTWGMFRARTALQAQHQAREDLRRELYVADLQLADQIWESGYGSAKKVAELLAGYVPDSGETDLREFAWRLQWTTLNQNSLVLKGNGSGSRIVAFTGGQLITLDEDLILRRWSHPDGVLISQIKLKGVSNVSCWSISSDARRIALGSFDRVHLFDALTGESHRVFSGNALVLAQSLSRDGRRLSVAWGDGRIQVWNTETQSEPASYRLKNPDDATALDGIELSPDGRRIYLLDYPENGQLSVLSEDSTESLCETQHHSGIYSIAFTTDGQWRATGDANGQVCLSDGTNEASENLALRAHRDTVSVLVFSADGKWLATGGVDGVVTVWDVAHREQTHTFKGHLARIHSLSFAGDGSTVASASDDGDTRVWNLKSDGSSKVLGTQTHPVFSVAYSSDGRRIAFGTGTGISGPGGFASIWDVATGRQITSLRAADGRVLALAFSKDGTRLMTGGYDSKLRVWDSETGEPIGQPSFPGVPSDDFQRTAIGSLAVSPDGSLVAAGFGHPTIQQSDYEQVITVWDVATGQVRATLKGHFNTVCQVAFSPDGTMLASASDDLRVKLWSTRDWKIVRTFEGTERFKSVTFSIDSKKIVAGDSNGDVTIWTAQGVQPISRFHGHASAVQRVVYSPDGRTLATASWDNTIKLWEPVSGRQTSTFRDHKDWISCMAFAPDGNSLVTGSFDATVRLWRAATFDEILAIEADKLSRLKQWQANQQSLRQERAQRKAQSRAASDLVRFSGDYHNGVTIGVENDHLTIQPVEGLAGLRIRLDPQSDSEFFSREFDLDVKFIDDDRREVSRAIIYRNGIAHEVRRTSTLTDSE